MIETVVDRFAAHVAERAYHGAPIICHAGGGYCGCGKPSLIWEAIDGGSPLRLCEECFTADQASLLFEVEQTRIRMAARLAAVEDARRLGIPTYRGDDER